jgi:hypothetical protein
MNATLNFDLPEDNQAHLEAVHASVAWNTLDAIHDAIRSHRKYEAELNLESIMQDIFEARALVLAL